VREARYTVSGAWLCHTGKVRRQNEDSCLVVGALSGESNAVPALVVRPTGPWIVAVADGIGGHVAGHEASRAVVETLARCPRVTPAALRDTLRQLNRDLCAHGRQDAAFAGMGTTVAGVGCGATGLFAFHVGDSRVYRVEASGLTQLTRDDSEAEELIEMGLLSADAEMRPGYLHALTQAIGGRLEHVEIEVHTQPLKVASPERFLICTDGLTDMVGRVAIEEITRLMRAPDVTVEALFGLAMDAGGLDNITLAIIDVEPVPRPPRGSGRS
jgi:serine/threonine protein phosphatase PrpC